MTKIFNFGLKIKGGGGGREGGTCEVLRPVTPTKRKLKRALDYLTTLQGWTTKTRTVPCMNQTGHLGRGALPQ